jgi:hypothetical protein
MEEEIKEYTIIYAKQVGYNRGQTVTKYQYLACVPSQLNTWIDCNIEGGNVLFVFKGFCEHIE